MSLVYVILLISCVMVVLLSAGNANGHHDDCPDSFDCGTLGTFSFPFTTVERHNCGVLAIQGCNDPNQTSVKYVQLNNKGKPFQVTHVSSHGRRPRSISIIDMEFSKLLENGSCAVFNYNITVPPSSPMGYFDLQNNISTFNCSRHQHKLNHTNDFINYTGCPSSDFYFAPPYSDYESLRSLISSCSMVKLPVRQDSQFFKDPFGFLTAEITFEFKFSNECLQCYHGRRDGNCRLDSKGNFYCANR